MGWVLFIGPIIGGALFFGKDNSTGNLDSVKNVYIVIAVVVLIVAFLFYRTAMPEVKEEELMVDSDNHKGKTLFEHSHLVWAIAAQFFYVAAQVGIAALFINYCTEKNLGITNEKASYYLSFSLILFTIGRFTGTAIMNVLHPPILLGIYALINIILCGVVIWIPGMISIYALMAIFFLSL